MKRSLLTCTLTLTLALTALGSSATPAATEDFQAPASALEQVRHSLWEALGKARAGDKSSEAQLATVIESPAFSQLTSSEQHQALFIEGVIVGAHDKVRAHELLVRSSALPQAVAADWVYRIASAVMTENSEDATFALTKLARDWPETARKLNADAIYSVTSAAKSSASKSDAYFNLLQALYAAEWRQSFDREPSALWTDLAGQLLERHQLDEAKAVAERITSAYYLTSMRADNRFAALIKLNPAHYDVEKAAAANLEKMRAISAQSPRSLEAIGLTANALLSLDKNQEAADLTDAAIRKALNDPTKPAFDDAQDFLPKVMEIRTVALTGLGKWDDAARQLASAARRPEHGGMNVSQNIDLASLYNDMGRPKDALAAIDELPGISSYGRMQLESVRYHAALQLNDAKMADEALSYMRDHQDDSRSTYESALIQGNRLDEAAAVFKARLVDPVERSDILAEIQDCPDGPMTEIEKEYDAHRTALKSRADVKAAIASVGKIERYSSCTIFEP